ncbi:hypothetical protein [Pelomonas sp. SE-A7]|uniref:hypothetical protein n=1 Tax=Pelomonas sp. SE-A7 TaxID=3054953 RepID=UPI00259CE61F|nr:hypothetical protein [Pelomonas sp. SE-A7]MDM4766195.1 hypothetical protein [Pelomonas sp. SE-A7]
MPDLDLFAEILVIGGLLLLALSPLIVRLSPLARQGNGFIPAVDYLKEGSGRLAIVVLLSYALGVAGNRLIDDGLDLLIKPGQAYSDAYKAWASQDSKRPPSLKHAEFLLRERSEATRAWFDRHKSFVRVLRGAAAACALLLLTMTAYECSKPPKPRYRPLHFFGAGLLLVIFANAYYLEAKSYSEKAYDLYRHLPPVKLGWDPNHVEPTGISVAEAKAGLRPA